MIAFSRKPEMHLTSTALHDVCVHPDAATKENEYVHVYDATPGRDLRCNPPNGIIDARGYRFH